MTSQHAIHFQILQTISLKLEQQYIFSKKKFQKKLQIEEGILYRTYYRTLGHVPHHLRPLRLASTAVS